MKKNKPRVNEYALFHRSTYLFVGPIHTAIRTSIERGVVFPISMHGAYDGVIFPVDRNLQFNTGLR